jgi:hypothetical protein
MKDAFQQQHEGEDNDDYMLGPGGKRVLTPEATQRKLVKDRAAAEEVSPCLLSHSPYNHSANYHLVIKIRIREQ